MIGVERVLFGSDWPHPEGNIEPADYAECIQKLDATDVKKIMRDNAPGADQPLAPPRTRSRRHPHRAGAGVIFRSCWR